MRQLARWIPALLGLVVLAIGVARWEQLFDEPRVVLWVFAVPALAIVLNAAFALLPTNGRLALGSTLAVLFLAECGARVVDLLSAPEVEVAPVDSYVESNPDLGYAPIPGAAARSWRRLEGETVYDVDYSFDAQRRRVTPIDAPEARDRFLLWFGGSLVFGEGVGPEETLPYRVAQLAPRYAPYNYGFRGYGPSQMLVRLEAGELRAEVAEPEGLLIYLMIDDHVKRVVGTLIVHSGWAHATPFYVLDEAGIPRRRGSLTSGRPATAMLFSLLGRSAVLKAISFDLPRVREQHEMRTARVLGRAAELFRAQFGNRRFVVVIAPGSVRGPTLARLLADDEIEILDYSDLFDPWTPENSIPGDGHPTPRAHARLAEQLAHDLGLGEALTAPVRAPLESAEARR